MWRTRYTERAAREHSRQSATKLEKVSVQSGAREQIRRRDAEPGAKGTQGAKWRQELDGRIDR